MTESTYNPNSPLYSADSLMKKMQNKKHDLQMLAGFEYEDMVIFPDGTPLNYSISANYRKELGKYLQSSFFQIHDEFNKTMFEIVSPAFSSFLKSKANILSAIECQNILNKDMDVQALGFSVHPQATWQDKNFCQRNGIDFCWNSRLKITAQKFNSFLGKIVRGLSIEHMASNCGAHVTLQTANMEAAAKIVEYVNKGYLLLVGGFFNSAIAPLSVRKPLFSQRHLMWASMTISEASGARLGPVPAFMKNNLQFEDILHYADTQELWYRLVAKDVYKEMQGKTLTDLDNATEDDFFNILKTCYNVTRVKATKDYYILVELRLPDQAGICSVMEAYALYRLLFQTEKGLQGFANILKKYGFTCEGRDTTNTAKYIKDIEIAVNDVTGKGWQTNFVTPNGKEVCFYDALLETAHLAKAVANDIEDSEERLAALYMLEGYFYRLDVGIPRAHVALQLWEHCNMDNPHIAARHDFYASTNPAHNSVLDPLKNITIH